VVAVVPAPDDVELFPPVAASATPVPARAVTVRAVANSVVRLGRNTCDLLSVEVSRPWNFPWLRDVQEPPKKWMRLCS
jgi:hypothetical protein